MSRKKKATPSHLRLEPSPSVPEPPDSVSEEISEQTPPNDQRRGTVSDLLLEILDQRRPGFKKLMEDKGIARRKGKD